MTQLSQLASRGIMSSPSTNTGTYFFGKP